MRRVVICAVALVGVFSLVGGALASSPNRIRLTVQRDVIKNKDYSVMMRAFARRRAVAYVFVDYRRCARSIAAERTHVNYRTPYHFVVTGVLKRRTGWQSHSKGVDHACGYLISYSSGALLATSRVSFEVH
jgi:hypothetical protein